MELLHQPAGAGQAGGGEVITRNAAFYAGLPVLTDFQDVGSLENYSPLPDEWHIALCDVRNSTAAVEAGRYKNVNTVGAAVITAMLNASSGVEIPFIFEGDGAMLCVPPQLLQAARDALLQSQHVAKSSFGLDLRIATLPLAQVRAAGHQVLVTRYRVSDHYIQAVFAGGGNTPRAFTLMAMELFRAPICIFAAVACLVSYLFSGHTVIYKAQLIEQTKHQPSP